MSSSAIEVFTSSVSPTATRIQSLPAIVLVFGGPLSSDPHSSARQIFINWLLAKRHAISPLVRTPEQFEDWNKLEGYENLIDFERDAGSLSKAIVLFSESAGSFAELGAFCMDDVLAERLFVVVDKYHYNAGSFIANGPIKKIEKHHKGAICVVDTIDPKKIEPQLGQVADAVLEKINSTPRTIAFDPTHQRDQSLLVADIVELFGALTEYELLQLIRFMGVGISRARLEQIVNQLIRFELVHLVGKMTKRFVIPPKNRESYLNYATAQEGTAFDRQRFKLKQTFPWLTQDKVRFEAYREVHPGS